jgi:hypothetical protein
MKVSALSKLAVRQKLLKDKMFDKDYIITLLFLL